MHFPWEVPYKCWLSILLLKKSQSFISTTASISALFWTPNLQLQKQENEQKSPARLSQLRSPPPFFAFLGPHLWHMEVPRLGVESELQLPAYTAATATSDLSCVCDLHHTAHSNGKSLTQWARPGIKPVFSLILSTLGTTKPQWELPHSLFFIQFHVSDFHQFVFHLTSFFSASCIMLLIPSSEYFI